MKKWLYRIAVFALLATLFCTSVISADVGPRTVRVGYFDYDGFLEKSPDGGYTGYGYDYLNEISSYLGWEYEFVYGNWEQCLQRLAAGEIDLLCTAQYSEERARLYDYAKYASGVEYATLLVRGDNDTVYYDDYESFDGLRVGFMKDSYQNGLFEEFARQHQFGYEAAYYRTALELKAALDKGEIDAMLTGSLQKIMGEKAVAKFAPEPFYFITTKGNNTLMDGLNSALEAIQTADASFNSRLYDKYYGEASASQLAFTREEAAYIRAHPVLRVAYDGAWNPISYQDEAGNFDGVCAGLMDLLSQRSGITFTFMPAPKEGDAVQLLESGEVDILCGVDNRYIPKNQQEKIQLTKSFFSVPVSVSKPSYLSFDDISLVAIPENCQSIQRYAQTAYPDAQMKIYADTEACMLAVKHGTADAVLENVYILNQYARDRQFSELEPVLTAQVILPLCLGMRRDEDLALRTLLNKLITQMDSQQVNEIIIRKTTEGLNLHFGGWLRRYIVVILLALALLVMLLTLYSRRQIARYAFLDPLTKRPNENQFKLAAQKIHKHTDSFIGYSVVSLDIDKFKFINNIYGFETGNRVLAAIADQIAAELRGGELFCRQANDHFVLLLKSDSEERLLERLKGLMDRATRLPAGCGDCCRFTLSCGVYTFSNKEDDLNQAIGWASLSREKAKNRAANYVVFYNVAMRKEALREQEITGRMELALSQEEFVVYYQPKILLEGERIVGAEALVRWKPGDGNLIFPDEFIPLFERNGFILHLDHYVFEQVCRQLRSWIDQGLRPCPVSVNLSREHLTQPDFYVSYFEVMQRYQIAPELIELEITESTLFENRSQVTLLLNRFKERGVSVSIDDFGSGYSSLNMLKDLPFDYLKMDKEFFGVASDSQRGMEVIRSVIELATRLHMTVVAEGVETLEQVEFLKDNHCDMVQGYYFSRPLPADEFKRFLRGGQEKGGRIGVHTEQ